MIGPCPCSTGSLRAPASPRAHVVHRTENTGVMELMSRVLSRVWRRACVGVQRVHVRKHLLGSTWPGATRHVARLAAEAAAPNLRVDKKCVTLP